MNLQKLIANILFITVSNANTDIFYIIRDAWSDRRNKMRSEKVEVEICVKEKSGHETVRWS